MNVLRFENILEHNKNKIDMFVILFNTIIIKYYLFIMCKNL